MPSVPSVRVAKVRLDGNGPRREDRRAGPADVVVGVVYTSLHRSPELVVEAAIQQDVGAVGISILSGAHMTLVPRIIELMRARDPELPILVGGTIPDNAIVSLKAIGASKVFTPGTPTSRIVDVGHELVRT